jgi:hypothetical protein
VTAGGTTSGINLALTMGGRITGTIRNAATGNPVPNVNVTAYVRFPDFIYEFGQIGWEEFEANAATSNASGVFTIANLPTGSYYLSATFDTNQDLMGEIYPNIQCGGGCDGSDVVEEGSPVAVTAGATTSGTDFSLDLGGSISGTITNGATGAPIANVTVVVVQRRLPSTGDPGGSNFFGQQSTNASGVYTVRGLPAGTYYAFTFSPGVFNSKIYGDILCPGFCSDQVAVESGTPIQVTVGSVTTGRNFVLEPGGAISGTVTNQGNGALLQGVNVTVVGRTGTRFVTKSATTNAQGNYNVNGLPTGTYWAFTSNSLGFINEIFDNVQCRGECKVSTAAATGAGIQVTGGSTTTGRNFALQMGGRITGTVTDANGVLAGIGVDVWHQNGSTPTFVGSTQTNGTGQYTLGGLMGGNYLVATHGYHGFINEVHNNVACVAQREFGEPGECAEATIATGSPVAVTPGGVASGVNFALSFGSIVRGIVTDASTGAPVDLILVGFFDPVTGEGVNVGYSVYGGQFTAIGMPPGEYVAFAYSFAGYINELYGGIHCAGLCEPAEAISQGTRITVPANGLVTGIDFALDRRTAGPPAAPREFQAAVSNSTAQFSWLAPPIVANTPATSYVIQAGFAPGTTALSIPVAGTSYSAPGVPPGVYYVRVRGVNAAGMGAASSEVRLVVGSTGNSPPEAPINPAASIDGARLTFTWADAPTGNTPTSYIVEAGSATGLSNIATLPVSAKSFTFNSVPPGFYFLRVRGVSGSAAGAPSAEVMIVVGGVPSPPPAPNFTALTATGSTVSLTWTPTGSDPVTSYVIEAGTATGLADIASINTGTPATTASFSSVPPGIYYLRLRAVNAQGASVVSNERVFTIP